MFYKMKEITLMAAQGRDLLIGSGYATPHLRDERPSRYESLPTYPRKLQDRSCYKPHQGEREIKRRKQRALDAKIKTLSKNTPEFIQSIYEDGIQPYQIPTLEALDAGLKRTTFRIGKKS